MFAQILLRLLAAVGAVVVGALVWNGVEYLPQRLAGPTPAGPEIRIEAGRVYAGETELATRAGLDDLTRRFERHGHGRGIGSPIGSPPDGPDE